MLPQVWGGSSASSYYRAASHFLWLSQAAFYQPIDRPGQAGERAASQCQLPARTSVSPKVYQPLIWPRSPALPPSTSLCQTMPGCRVASKFRKQEAEKAKQRKRATAPKRQLKDKRIVTVLPHDGQRARWSREEGGGGAGKEGGVGREAAGMSASRRRR